MTIETSYPRGLHDIQRYSAVLDQSLPNVLDRTRGKSTVEMRPPALGQDLPLPWPTSPPHGSAMLSNGAGSGCSSSGPKEAYSPSMSPSGGSFDAFKSLSDGVNTIGSLRFNPPDEDIPQDWLHHPASPEHSLAERQDGFVHYPTPPDVGSMYASYDSQSPSNTTDAISPHSGHSQFMSTSLSPNVPGDGITTTDNFFNKVMNGQLASEKILACHPCENTASVSNSGFPPREAVGPNGSSTPAKKWLTYLTSVTDNYGLDSGRSDLDLNKNDDHSAIDINYALDLINSQSSAPLSSEKSRSSPARQAQLDGTKYTYYSSPVPVNIPRYLSPLPSTLVQTPINLMYFHHFLNHTARMLVAHDCGNNPFVSVLPTMAIGDANLLNLMLAYSASHRARYLEHPEPTNRIAHWVSNVFPTLRLALEDPHEKVTDSHLAAAIMLLSLKIISPSTFEVPIPWQSHLKLARDLYLARKSQMTFSGNPVGAFLSRWLGYLDIMGTLSCRHSEPPLMDYYSVLSTCCADEAYDEFSVDCFTGFTPRTGLYLMRLGQLVNQCDNERFDEMGRLNLVWQPSVQTITSAEELLAELKMLHVYAHADEKHFQATEMTGIVAMDASFRHAGFLHLHRRVLDTPSSTKTVKEGVNELIHALAGIRSWDSSEVAALFPLFTAGCEAQDPQQRLDIKERFEGLDGTGMKQMQNARRLIQRCWDENKPWISLAQGEFLG